MSDTAPLYDHDGITLYCGATGMVLPELAKTRTASVVVTDPTHWYRHEWVQREGGQLPFDIELQRNWQTDCETMASALLSMLAEYLGHTGSAWIFTHPCYVPAYGAAAYRLAQLRRTDWMWQRLWMRRDDVALILLGTRGLLIPYAEAIQTVLDEEPYCPPYQPDRLLDLIVAGSRPDDVVLDPFCGSGGFLQAARRQHRRAIGIEMQPDLAAHAAHLLTLTEDCPCA